MFKVFNQIKSNGSYRSDIDGLRAIACIAVVLYHAFPTVFRGGFIGVDIFFVISGYLISSILYKSLFDKDAGKVGTIDLLDFYVRRIKRIFPALLAVLVACLSIGWFILLPDEYELLGKHTLGGSIYINNIMLYQESGDYFNVGSNAKPLLHLWSLGVEEQFYLIFPVFLFVVYKLNLNFVLTLAAFTVLSFFLNLNAVNHGLSAKAFYLPWYRFWELSIGAILAYVVNYKSEFIDNLNSVLVKNKVNVFLCRILFRTTSEEQQSKIFNNILAWTGLIAIVIGIMSIQSNDRFPGKIALVPVLGALLIIAANKKAFINSRLLSSRAVVFLGLISYPLYLWHFPLLSIPFICYGEMPPSYVRCIAILLAIVLAVITFLFIEPPLRYGSYPRVKALGLLFALLAVGFLGYRVMDTGGFKNRMIDKTEQEYIDKTVQERDELAANCQNNYYQEWKNQGNKCYMSNEQKDVAVDLFGDSAVGINLGFGIHGLFKKGNKSYNLFSVSCQNPFFGFRSAASGNTPKDKMRSDGKKEMDRAFLDAINNPNIKLFVFSHNPGCSFPDLVDTVDEANNSKSAEEKLNIGLRRTMDMLEQKGKKALFVLANPRLPFEPSKCQSSKRKIVPYFIETECSFERSMHDKNTVYASYNQVINEAAVSDKNINVIDLSRYFCDSEKCHAMKNNKVLYTDVFHLSPAGSEYVAHYVYEKMEEILNAKD